MTEKCDRCQHSNSKVIQPIHIGTWKIPETKEIVYLCKNCYADWGKIWTKNIRTKSINMNLFSCTKILKLWNEFYSKNGKEVVQFT